MAKTLYRTSDRDDLLQQLKDLSGKLWLAGIGAFVTVQRKGGKLLTNLIEEGKKLESRLVSSSAANRSAGPPKKQLTPDQMEQLEELFQQRVDRALQRLQVPTHQELRVLQRRMDELSAAIQLLGEELGD